VHQPLKIIIPGNAAKSSLAQSIISQWSADKIAQVPRSRFSDATGLSLLASLSKSGHDDQLHNRYLAISSAAACLIFAQDEANLEIASRSLKVDFKALEGHLLIDSLTLRQFSILSSGASHVKLTTPKRSKCPPTLFNLCDRCWTPSGSRFLRATLAMAPSDREVILRRQNFVAELVGSDFLFSGLNDVLGRVIDLDPVLTFLVAKSPTASAKISLGLECLQNLLRSCAVISDMQEILGQMKCDLAKTMAADITASDFKRLAEFLRSFLEPANDCNSIKKDYIYAVKKGAVTILDVARKSYEDSLSAMIKLVSELSDKYQLKISLKSNKSRRFHLSMQKNSLKKREIEKQTNISEAVHNVRSSASGYCIPSELIHVMETQTQVTGTTYDLLLLNKKNESSENDCLAISNQYIQSKLDEIREFIKGIYKVSETIGLVDCLLSFAAIAREYSGYIKPNLSDNQVLIVKGVRHPVLEHLQPNNPILFQSRDRFVATNLEMSTARRMIILRGVNMSGKTTLLQTAIQVTVMAQCGAFVPAKSAVIAPFTSIFTRTGTIDSLEGNASAFLVEMQEMQQIVSHANGSSLIAIDEPCVSTCVRDGIGISFACLERLIAQKSFVLCATHFDELEILGSLYNSVMVKEMRTRERTGEKLEFLYELGDGSSTESGYGIKIAADVLPLEMIREARSVFDVLIQSRNSRSKDNVYEGSQARSALIQRLLSLGTGSLDDDALSSALAAIKANCRRKNTA
jgi:DNA mismatch repair protein MSH4